MPFSGRSDNVVAPKQEAVEPDGSTEWPIQATDAIVRAVDSVRDKTTGPALKAASYVIYGLVILLLSLPLFILLLVGIFRATEGLLLWLHSTYAWADFLHDPIGFVYLFYGVVFVLAALTCWRMGKKPVAGAT